MHITWKELTVQFDPEKAGELLSDWRWLVGERTEFMLAGSLGDLFLRDETGQVLWLDTGAGQLSVVAGSHEEFRELLQQPNQVNEWFLPQLVGDLLASGKQLAPGQCFSYKVPPMLGGKVEPENFEPTDLSVHCSILGQIARKNQDLPDRTPIQRVTLSDD
ncbi:DUF1851 domain-containing protein [Luteolibacter arcticus]|uniref:DUF1851 domain-containing protein n=1 Tax=Luteolibacter arcticus TaxID=1581411 RepID=A0ABT3GSC8_9BACT|nr:DUF1851 domain-containing protein [Luteolibacter arcticus]MCW1926417.1 DUF1851 domain-containing protein [Luteolibacter arcticus]